MALGESVFTKSLNLGKDRLGKFALVAARQHAVDDSSMKGVESAFASPGGHRTAQLIGLARGEPGREDGDLHHLFLKNRDPERALERRTDFVARIVDPLQSLATAQVRVNHAALDRTRPDDGDLDHEIVEAAWPQARQHRHLRPRFDLKHPDRIAA